MEHLPRLSETVQGILLFSFGLVLFLYVTGLLTMGTPTLILLASLALMAYGFIKMDGPRRFKKLMKK
jgi:hypothetical protein